MNKLFVIISILMICTAVGGGLVYLNTTKKTVSRLETRPSEPTPTIVLPTITAVPTMPKQLSLAEINKLYGPCTTVKVIMYHHIQHSDVAKANGYQGLTVTPEAFKEQMQYLKDNGYNVIFVDNIANYFDNGASIGNKSVAITLDDAYDDNYLLAYPILKEYGFKATIFTPTGLVNNPGYLTWDEIKEMSNSGLVRFGNHTWSHHASSGTVAEQDKEIELADTQLKEKGLDMGKIFAYPYGNPSRNAEEVLNKYGYSIAFTTKHGQFMCKGQRFELPRIRVGGESLSKYGF